MAEPFRTRRLQTPTLSRVLAGGAPAPRPTAQSRLVATPLRQTARTSRQQATGTLTGRPLAPLAPRLASTRARGPIRPKEEDKGILGGIASILPSFVGAGLSTVKALPTFIGKVGQTVGGLGELAYESALGAVGVDYNTRYEKDLAKGRELGLKGTDLVEYAMQRMYPAIGGIIGSGGRTAARAAEVATLGFYDTGEAGVDYYKALRRGDLGAMLFEDIGNVVLAGRAAGAGNLGVRGGARLSNAGRTRLGSTVSSIGRFVEEPIASTARGVARTGLRVPKVQMGPQLREARLASIAASEQPLRAAVNQAGTGFRRFAENRVTTLDSRRGQLLRDLQLATEEGRTGEARTIENSLDQVDRARTNWLRVSETQARARRSIREEQINQEAIATTFPQMVLRYEQLGTVPDSPEQLGRRSAELRTLAEQATEPARQQQLTAQADFLDRQARVKTTGDQQKLNDPENRKINFSAAVIVTSKIIDQIMRDRQAGKSVDEIMDTIQPRELLPDVEQAGYGYTKEAVQRAIDFAEGRLDEVDLLDMDVASSLLSSVAGYLEGLATQPGTLVSGVLSPAQFGDTPVPEIFSSELNGLRIEPVVLSILDDMIPQVITDYFPERLEEFDKVYSNPEGAFKKFADAKPDTPEYSIARVVLLQASEILSDPATSPLAGNPRTAIQVAEFFKKPEIYGARMRPMLAYRTNAGQEARAADVNSGLYGLRQLVSEFEGMIPTERLNQLNDALDEFRNPRRQFDRDFYLSVQKLIRGVLNDINRQKGRTRGQLQSIDARTIESTQRLAEVEAQARAVAGMVEQALFRPEELTPTPRVEVTPEQITSALDNVKTGQPMEATLYRGRGGVDVRGTGDDSLFGPGVYATPDLQYAQTFATDFSDIRNPQLVGTVDQVSVRLENPLVISTADQWRALTSRAGWEFPKISNESAQTRVRLLSSLRALIESEGYDGVIIKMDERAARDSALGDMAGGDQVVAFNPASVSTPQERARLTGVTAESQTLRSEASRLRSEAAQLQGLPDTVNTIRTELDSNTTKLTEVRRRAEEASTEARDLEGRLAIEERLLRDGTMPEDEIPLFLAELDEAIRRREQGVDAEPTPVEQRAWKTQRVAERQRDVDVADNMVRSMFQGGEVPQISREDFWSPDVWVRFKRRIRNDRHLREFFQRNTTSKYADKSKSRIPVRADEAVVDPNVGKLLGGGVVYLDEVASDFPGGSISIDEFVDELAARWTAYMDAVDSLNEAKRKPLKSEKQETVLQTMLNERANNVQNQAWENPLTGETVYGIRSLEQLQAVEKLLTSTEALADQVRKVETLRRDLEIVRRRSQEGTREARDIDARINELSRQAVEAEAQSPRMQAGRLTSQADNLSNEANRLDAQNVRLRPAAARERLTLTRDSGRRMRVAKTRLSETKPRRVEGYEFTGGVARKLEAAEQAELGRQQRLFEKNRRLQAKFNEEDAALAAGQDVAAGAQGYVGSLSAPTGRAVLEEAQRPRLMGETMQPTWIPVGEGANVRPTASADVRMMGEGMAPESKISIERQRTSTFMAQTPEQFANRITSILKQVSRNRVVNRIITDELITTDVQTLIGEEALSRITANAERRIEEQGIGRGTQQFDAAVKKEVGDRIIEELDLLGYEPVSPSVIPEEGDVFSGRAPVGNMMSQVKGENMTPTTLVMRRGLREGLSSYFAPQGGSRIPPGLATVFEGVGKYTAKWKSVVLPFSLRWQVGDAMGNIINAHVRAGLTMPELSQRMIEVNRRLREPTGMTQREMMFGDILNTNIADPVIQVLIGAGLQARGLRLSDLREMHPSGTLKPPPGGGRLGKVFFPRFREASFAFNETQNTMVRSAVALNKLDEALAARGRNINEIDPVTVHNDPVLYEAVRQAVSEANDALGNFSDLSPFEKQTVRTVYPFWTWIKFINKAAAQLLINQPDRVLFYGHLGSIVAGDDGQDLYDWLKDMTPVPIPGVGNVLVDLSFTNPYSDAILFGRDPLAETANVATNISPVLRAGLRTGGEIAFGRTGRRLPLLEVVSRPGYLEGRPGSTTRSAGDVLGGIAYQNFRTFAGPYRFLTDVVPTVRVPGTDVLLGPGPRYPQGSPRTTGVYGRPLLSPTQERIGALLSSVGTPGPAATLEEAQAQGREIARNERRSLRRRQQERRLSRIRQ